MKLGSFVGAAVLGGMALAGSTGCSGKAEVAGAPAQAAAGSSA